MREIFFSRSISSRTLFANERCWSSSSRVLSKFPLTGNVGGYPSYLTYGARAGAYTQIHTDRNLRTFVERIQVRSHTRVPSTLQTASLCWVAFAYENQEVSRLARLLLAKAKNGGARSCAGTDAKPPAGVTEGALLPRQQKLLLQRARVLPHFDRLKYSMASRSRLGMQISSGESHVPAPGLILYPETRVPPLPRFSHLTFSALSIYPSAPAVLYLSMVLVST